MEDHKAREFSEKQFTDAMDYIKKTFEIYLTKDDIQQEMWSAMSHSMSEFLENNAEDIIARIADKLLSSSGIEVAIKIKKEK